MKISDGLYVVFEYDMHTDDGDRIGGTEPNRPIGFIVGKGHMLPVIEKRLLGMSAGDRATLWLMPAEAFGEVDPKKKEIRSRESFPPHVELKKGACYQVPGERGPVPFHIAEIGEDTVTIDMNHPLAGKRIRLEVHIHEVRKLSAQEQQQIEQSKQNRPDPFIPPGMTGGAVKV